VLPAREARTRNRKVLRVAAHAKWTRTQAPLLRHQRPPVNRAHQASTQISKGPLRQTTATALKAIPEIASPTCAQYFMYIIRNCAEMILHLDIMTVSRVFQRLRDQRVYGDLMRVIHITKV